MNRLQALIALGLAFVAAVVPAPEPVDVNSGNRAQLEQLRVIGPPLAERILAEREARGPFRDRADLIARVRGIREAKARQLSQAGLRVGQAPYEAAR
jgi:competence protein ComEA